MVFKADIKCRRVVLVLLPLPMSPAKGINLLSGGLIPVHKTVARGGGRRAREETQAGIMAREILQI